MIVSNLEPNRRKRMTDFNMLQMFNVITQPARREIAFWATVWRKNKKQKKLQWKLNRTDDKIDFWRQTETNPRRAVA